MGDQERMGHQCGQITLYTSQTNEVINLLQKDGIYYVKMEYVAKKYAEVFSVFFHAYSWYAENAGRILQRPPQAQSAIWTFCNAEYVERSPGCQIIKLSVPLKNAVFFRMSDWNKILNLQYLGGGREEEEAFSQKLAHYGIHNEMDAYGTAFYPHLKKAIQESWKKLFRYDREVKKSGILPYPDMQAGLWFIDRDWIA